MDSKDVIVCSFFTDDDYYRAHADNLRNNLENLGLSYELREIQKLEGEEWPDICRKKIGFIADVCAQYPDKKVFWIDVDCNLLSIPDYVVNTTADLIGFTRGFGPALKIGYEGRARFWEPCFWGLNTTSQARKLIVDAHNLEKASTLRATDDYFLEEAWRANAANLTFQIIPSGCVVGRGNSTQNAFFTFGASGNVAEFKGKVEQHVRAGGAKKKKSLRARGLSVAKKIEDLIPSGIARKLRRMVDGSGVTGFLVSGKAPKGDPARTASLNSILAEGKNGTTESLEAVVTKFQASYIPTKVEANTIEAAKTFSLYASKPATEEVLLAWWPRPFPGNFGDWLSPLIVSNYTDAKIFHQSVSRVAKKEHIIGLGSIGRFIKSNSIVCGTGISTDDLELNNNAEYVSVRGPITAEVVKKSGGPDVTSFGDPGILLSRIIPITRGATNGRLALVRHFTHVKIPLVKPANMDELDVLVGHPTGIRALLEELNKYDAVVTSAMHIYISCQSYGIPCALITFDGFEDAVHGNGIKYRDYSMGVGLPAINPTAVALDLTSVNFDDIIKDLVVSQEKMDEVEDAIRRSLTILANKS
ncbi:MAG: polysaccharide pyruvyl transferase family protein [Actinomycetes bacterium]